MDSLGPLIGPVRSSRGNDAPDACPLTAFPPPPPPRWGRHSFPSGRMHQTTPPLYTALVTRALSTLSSAVLPCWCLTGPQQSVLVANLSLLVKGFEKEDSGIRSIVAGIWNRVKSSLSGWKFVYGMIEVRKRIVVSFE